MNSWIQSIDKAELLKFCPELTFANPSETEEEVLNLVREEKAEYYFYSKMPRNMYPTPDPFEFSELQKQYINKGKDYTKEEVIEFEKNRKSYFGALKKEIGILICTDDKKYDALRHKLKQYGENTKAPIIATVSATLAGVLGVAVGVISGFVAIIFYSVIKIGLNAYCAMTNNLT